MFNKLLAELNDHQATIAVIGLGYVGLPLAVNLARRYKVIGFDIKEARIAELEAGKDRTLEVEPEKLKAASGNLQLSSRAEDLEQARVYIVTVPTPIDSAKRPDLRPLRLASRVVGKVLKPDDVVIYESTVYPGCTEEDCVPILERQSGLRFASEQAANPADAGAGAFFVGYSPERINPGDRENRLTTIVKVTSGSTPEAADFIDSLYASIVPAGTHKAPSIRVAEAAKVIENTQRDVNIALINELAMLFNRLGLDTQAVLAAAGTKWNFLPFKPGLVGGHCIGVDPYYLTHKAQQVGFHPQMILAGRRTNDGMGQFVAGELVKLMALNGIYQPGTRVLVLGLTFKENCPDLRNSRVIDVIETLRRYSLTVDIHDPWVDPAQARAEYGLQLLESPQDGVYSAAVICVAHNEFRELSSAGIRRWLRPGGVLYDLKHLFPSHESDARL